MYCPLCERWVPARKGFNWLAFIFPLGVLYIPGHVLKRRRCPICGNTKLTKGESKRKEAKQ